MSLVNHSPDTGSALIGQNHSPASSLFPISTDNTPLLSNQFVWQIDTITSTDGTVNYDYDKTWQLTKADFSYQSDETYTYDDDNGNRTNAGYSTGTNNQLLSDGTYNYTYDDEGNRLTKTNIATGVVEEYEWDYRNRLVSITTKDNLGVVIEEVEYVYDGLNNRIQKSVDLDGIGVADPVIETYAYDIDHMALVFDETDNVIQRFLHGAVIDQVLAQEEVNAVTGAFDEVYWTLGDHQGTLRDLMDNSGVLVNHLEYDSFGNVTAQTDPTVDLRLRYTGREWDGEINQYQYRARSYDAAAGRFVSEDPFVFMAMDTNLQRYVSNAAVLFSDSSGLLPEEDTEKEFKRNDENWLELENSGKIGYKADLVKIAKPCAFGTWYPYPKPSKMINPTMVHYCKTSKLPNGYYVGTGGAKPCVGLIIMTPKKDLFYCFHFRTCENPTTTIHKIGVLPDGSEAIIFGGDNNDAGSCGTLKLVYEACLEKMIDADNIHYLNRDGEYAIQLSRKVGDGGFKPERSFTLNVAKGTPNGVDLAKFTANRVNAATGEYWMRAKK